MLFFDPDERAAFRAQLNTHIAEQFPATRREWIENDRRLRIDFPDGATCTLYEPNFFFSRGSYSDAYLLQLAVAAITKQHQCLREQPAAA